MSSVSSCSRLSGGTGVEYLEDTSGPPRLRSQRQQTFMKIESPLPLAVPFVRSLSLIVRELKFIFPGLLVVSVTRVATFQ